jgi:flavin-dependent dehydrogenase
MSSHSSTHFEPEQAYDVAIIGAGPAAATVAALVAEAGHKTIMLERALWPRFHVGESLIPETYWTLERLGLIERLKASAFPKKYSVQFVSESGMESAPFYFDEYNPHESSQTWQVWRDEFDRMLVDNACAKGARLRDRAQVTEVLFDEERATGVRVRLTDGDEPRTRDVAARIVVDASGISGFLCNRLGLKETDPRLRKATVWSYFENAQRDPGRDEGATIILQTEGKKSWFWYIPLPENVVSIGCTGDLDYMFGDRSSASDVFQREVARCPAIAKRIEHASRCRDFFTTRDYSYCSKRVAGPGWVLAGDAAGFIDPVYSSGVFLALKSGELVADAVNEALAADDLSAERLGSWRPEYLRGLENFRNLVYAFYTPGFSFGTFLRKHPEYRTNLVDILIGDVFKPEVGEMFEAMQDVIAVGN